MKRASIFACLAAVLFVASSASAQVRAGLPIESVRALAAQGALELRSIDVPTDEGLPVRIALGRAGAGAAAVLVDVHVAASAGQARTWLSDHAASAAQITLVRRGAFWADTASGPAGIAAIVRDNVAAIVRTVDASVDAAAIADAIDSAIAASPAGSPRGPVLRAPEAPGDLAVGASHALQLPPGLLAARVVATGDAYARNTPNGWFVTRTGAGAFALRVVAVDAMLRVSR